MATKMRLGELLVQENLVSLDTLEQALRVQVGKDRRLGNILVRMKAITSNQLTMILSEQLNLPIVDITRHIPHEVKNVLPRYLCRQYCVLPLGIKANNVLEVAMSDPLDSFVITELENYTGMVVEPCLALESEISKEIPRCIPLGLRDVFSSRMIGVLSRVAIIISLLSIILLGSFTFRYIQKETYGSISVTAESTMYKNHDLMIGFDNKGRITLIGKGAYAKGIYSVSFNDPEVLKSFLVNRKNDFSDKQAAWLDWVTNQARVNSVSRTESAKNEKL